MNLNADFTQRARVFNAENRWQASPSAGVDRKMLDRIGEEVARATTIVRYAPNSAFPAHVHTGGEEFIVLDGVFQDEHGDFPAGSYIRNPPTSSHTPGSDSGCTIFVKLWQFDLEDRHPVSINMNTVQMIADPVRPGVSFANLHLDDRESVQKQRWEPNTAQSVDTKGGAEILVLSGSISEGGETFGQRDWLRLPDGHAARLESGDEGAVIWIKSGHLRHVTTPDVARAAQQQAAS